MPPLIVKGSLEEISKEFVQRFEKIANESTASRKGFSFGVTGGSVAERLLPPLRNAQVDWKRVQVFFGDERAVPPSSAESNDRLAREKLFKHISIDPGQIHRMEADRPDLRSAAEAYEHQLTKILGVPPKLDLMLLGVGEDGHVGSLFPSDPALQDTEHWVIPIFSSPKPPAQRLSLSIKTLTAARKIFIAAFGRGKADVIHQALNEPASMLPISQVIRAAGDVTFFLDHEASNKISVVVPTF